MSLNPSNQIAARNNPDKMAFPNLARRVNWEDKSAEGIGNRAVIFGEVDAQCLRELGAAGVKHEPEEPADWLREKREVPFGYIGTLCGWSFRRAWYYWVAEGPGVPADKAQAFHETWGQQVRVDGHCGCPSPLEWHHGFAVGMYHIDTQEGLNAFAGLLRSIYVEVQS